MTTAEPKSPRVLVRASERGPDESMGHPYNPRAEMHGWLLSRPAGLRRIAVNLAWLPPGKESNAFHLHHREEEWLYVLEGRGTVELEGGEQPVGPGDFLGFPAGVPHLTKAGPDERFLYLEGGEVIPDVEVADFPRLGRRLVRMGAKYAVYPLEAEVPFLPPGVDLPPDFFGAAKPAEPPRVLVRSDDRGPAREYHHPQNPHAEIQLTPLSRPAGLRRVAVVHSRVPAGRESFVRHVHHHDEEWMYVLEGRGVAELDGREVEIGPGDFLGFPAGGPVHNVRAAPDGELAYLAGGDAWSRDTIEIVDFPDLGRRKTLVGTRSAMTFPLDAADEARR